MQQLDFKKGNVSYLFFSQLSPALLGMISSALYVVVDGIFVGQGIGSHGIAAVNINNPLMTFVSGIGLMFGMGSGVIASLHLSRGQYRATNRILTQTVLFTFVLSCFLSLLLCLFPRKIGFILGSDNYLINYVSEYLFWYAQCFPFMVMMTILPFFSSY